MWTRLYQIDLLLLFFKKGSKNLSDNPLWAARGPEYTAAAEAWIYLSVKNSW